MHRPAVLSRKEHRTSNSDSAGAENMPSDGIPVPAGWDDPYEETLTVTIGGLGIRRI